MEDRVGALIKWLQLPEEKRPHLVTFYLPQADGAGHTFGPDSKQTQQAVQFIDSVIGRMVSGIDSLHLAVNFIFLSDHGMAAVDTTHVIPLPAVIDTSKFIIPPGEALVELYAKDSNDIRPVYEKLKADAKDYDVYLSTNTPPQWHYSKKEDRYNRIGDILLVPHFPKVFARGHLLAGNHGFDPAQPEMHATFYAWGPAFKKHLKTGDFENVNVYPLIAKILGLSYDSEIDGSIDKVKEMLK
jgi:predicted AlkP superfamily pyrophosphatase or phosphodiesterase